MAEVSTAGVVEQVYIDIYKWRRGSSSVEH